MSKADINIGIPHLFTQRPYQDEAYHALRNGYRRVLLLWHRRAGKDKVCLNATVEEMVTTVGTYYYFFPTYNQGRKVMWDGIDKRNNMKMMDHIPHELRLRTNSSEMLIELRHPHDSSKPGSIFQIIGTDKYDSVMGTNPIGCVFSEYALQDKRAWDYIRPILMENDGWAMFPYTPRGFNHGYKLYADALNNPLWFTQKLTVRDTVNVITPEKIEEERKAGMSQELIDQEFYCSFTASIPGAYYANEMRAMAEQGRIRRLVVEPNVPVWTYWDLGMDDSMSIWLMQHIGRENRCIGYYENSGLLIAHYVNWLKDWRASNGAVFGTHVLPHDGAVRGLQTGKSHAQHVREILGDVELAKKPKLKIRGIEAVRQFLMRTWIDDERCPVGIECLRRFRKEYIEKNQIYGIHPVRDRYIHGADAIQTAAMYHQPKTQRMGEPTIYGGFSGEADEGAWLEK